MKQIVKSQKHWVRLRSAHNQAISPLYFWFVNLQNRSYFQFVNCQLAKPLLLLVCQLSTFGIALTFGSSTVNLRNRSYFRFVNCQHAKPLFALSLSTEARNHPCFYHGCSLLSTGSRDCPHSYHGLPSLSRIPTLPGNLPVHCPDCRKF